MPPPRLHLPSANIAKWIHVPLPQAARKIGVCTAILKRACREHGIPRWPYRKISSLSHTLNLLRSNKSTWLREKMQAEKQELLQLRETVFAHVPITPIDDLLYRDIPLGGSSSASPSLSPKASEPTYKSVSSPPSALYAPSSSRSSSTMTPVVPMIPPQPPMLVQPPFLQMTPMVNTFYSYKSFLLPQPTTSGSQVQNTQGIWLPSARRST